MAVLPSVILLQHEAGVGHLWQVKVVGLLAPRAPGGDRSRLLKSFGTEVVAALEHGLPPLIGVQEELQSPIGLESLLGKGRQLEARKSCWCS